MVKFLQAKPPTARPGSEGKKRSNQLSRIRRPGAPEADATAGAGVASLALLSSRPPYGTWVPDEVPAMKRSAVDSATVAAWAARMGGVEPRTTLS